MTRRNRSIATVIIACVVAASTLFIGLVGFVAYRSYAGQSWERFYSEHSILADQVATSLVLPVWNFDRPQIDKVIESSMQNADVYGVVVRLADVKSSVQARARDDGAVQALMHGDVAGRGLIAETRKIVSAGDAVGEVTVFATPVHVMAHLAKARTWMFGAVAALGVVMAASLYILLWRLVLGALQELERYATRVSSGGSTEAAPRCVYRGELASLKASLERMVGLLHARLGEVQASEKQLRGYKTYLTGILDAMPSVLASMDERGVITLWNRRAEAVTGIPADKAVGQPVAAILPDLTAWIEINRLQDAPVSVERLPVEKGGTIRYYSLTLFPCVTATGTRETVVRVEDVTERAQTQALMIQTEKMLSLGGLAAGMAHEINNPLGIVAQAVQNIVRRVSPDIQANETAALEAGIDLVKLKDYFEKRQIDRFLAGIHESVARAAKIVSNMLQFSRRTDHDLKPVALDRIVEEALELAANDYDLKKRFDFRSIEIVREFDPSLPEVPAVRVEIEQVVLNLLRNAAQAMADSPSSRRPRLTLRLKRVQRYAQLEVEDNGPGMPEAVLRRVFEPFFTTKPPGVGTGLGLSVSYTIVTQNHKGLLGVESVAGSGARFTIKLPLASQEVTGG